MFVQIQPNSKCINGISTQINQKASFTLDSTNKNVRKDNSKILSLVIICVSCEI